MATVAEWIRALRFARARQMNLFYRNRREAFRWEQSLFPQKEKQVTTKTTTTPELYRQGDVMFRRVNSIPREGAVKRENGVIALGEVTGHSHAVADLTAAEVFDCGPDMFIHVGENGVSIRHEEHGAIQLPAGDYQINIQREYSPEEIRSVVD